MVDSIVRGTIQIVGAEAAVQKLRAYKAELASLGSASAKTTLEVDSSALARAKTDVASLGNVHQSLGSKAVSLDIDATKVQQARTAVKGMEGDVLSLASSVQRVTPILAFGTALVGVTAFATGYQTLLVQTANQTSLTTAEIDTMDKTIRELPSAGASLQSLATGFKNITDLGYSAADAQKIATEESKAATAAGADQATVMLAITSAMKEYNAAASDVAKYSNIVTEAARLGNTSLSAWTEGTRTGVAVAAAYGVSLQEADAFMVALTRHGFDASESATQLRGVIQHIVADPKPAAQKTIADIKKSTGIDLGPDFGPDALQVRGFTNIMQDLQDVVTKTGNDAFIQKLIPAMRGGTGALITVTQAAQDSKEALGLLGQAADGSLTPVEEGFDRVSKTAGYQWGQFTKQVKFDMIDIGQASLPAATSLAQAFGAVPAPVIKAGAEILLFGAAIKTVSTVGDLLVASTAKLGVSAAAAATATATNAAAMEAEAAAAKADIAALEALNAARAQGSLSPSIAAALQRDAAATTARVATTVEVEAAEVVTASAAAKVGSAVAGIGATLGTILVPVTIGIVAGKIISDQTVGRIASHVYDERANNNPDVQSADEFVRNVMGAPNPQEAATLAKNYIDTLNEDIATYEKDKAKAHKNFFQNDDGYFNAVISDLKGSEKRLQDALSERTAGVDPVELNKPTAPTVPIVSTAASEAAAQKKHDEDVKAAAIDVANFQKFQIQQVADTQIAAATKSADAWKAAASEVQAGKEMNRWLELGQNTGLWSRLLWAIHRYPSASRLVSPSRSAPRSDVHPVRTRTRRPRNTSISPGKKPMVSRRIAGNARRQSVARIRAAGERNNHGSTESANGSGYAPTAHNGNRPLSRCRRSRRVTSGAPTVTQRCPPQKSISVGTSARRTALTSTVGTTERSGIKRIARPIPIVTQRSGAANTVQSIPNW